MPGISSKFRNCAVPVTLRATDNYECVPIHCASYQFKTVSLGRKIRHWWRPLFRVIAVHFNGLESLSQFLPTTNFLGKVPRL